jgi:hypothetical protein
MVQLRNSFGTSVFSLRLRGETMERTPVNLSGPAEIVSLPNSTKRDNRYHRKYARRKLAFLAAAVLLSPLIFAQSMPQVTSVDPSSGKVNDSVSVIGADLGKNNVSAVYLSDDKIDYKATVVEQSAEKIIIKVPEVKSGNYNISIQVGDKLFIKPVRFKVQE